MVSDNVIRVLREKNEMDELKTGIKNHGELTVTKEMTADAWGSGGQPVFATPAMIALMENTAWKSVEPFMKEGQTTVGTHIDVKHLSASPLGARITCDSELIEIDRRRLVFHVAAYDDSGLIGEGTHERFIIDNQKFMDKTQKKLEQVPGGKDE